MEIPKSKVAFAPIEIPNVQFPCKSILSIGLFQQYSYRFAVLTPLLSMIASALMNLQISGS